RLEATLINRTFGLHTSGNTGKHFDIELCRKRTLWPGGHFHHVRIADQRRAKPCGADRVQRVNILWRNTCKRVAESLHPAARGFPDAFAGNRGVDLVRERSHDRVWIRFFASQAPPRSSDEQLVP